MAAITWAGPALEDLRQTYQFIARDSRQYAGIYEADPNGVKIVLTSCLRGV